MSEIIHEGKGTVEEKSEGKKKDGEKFWKFKINGKQFSLWDYEAGTQIELDQEIYMYWTEKPGTSSGREVTWRNINSIMPIEDASALSDKKLAEVEKEVDKNIGSGKATTRDSFTEGVRNGMLFKAAVDVAIYNAGQANKAVDVANIEKWFNSLKTLMNQLE